MQGGRIAAIIAAILLGAACGTRAPQPGRTIQDGVEIVTNSRDPSAGSDPIFTLREESRIDLEGGPAVAAGLGEAFGLAVDSTSAVYLLAKRSDPHIFKFDAAGRFERAFGRRGQGPGESGTPRFFYIGPDDEIIVTASGRIAVFAPDGTFRREIRLPPRTTAAVPLPGGNVAVLQLLRSPQTLFDPTLSIFDSSSRQIREMDRDPGSDHITLDRLTGNPTRYDGAPWVFRWEVGGGSIYVGRAKLGYEIQVFDSRGGFKRAIRKLYDPVPLSHVWKEEFLAPYTQDDPERRAIVFPAYMPAFSGFLLDEESRLLVSTYEAGKQPGQYRCDVFDAAGSLIGRADLPFTIPVDLSGQLQLLQASVRNNRLYHLRNSKSGFQEVAIYRIAWKESRSAVKR